MVRALGSEVFATVRKFADTASRLIYTLGSVFGSVLGSALCSAVCCVLGSILGWAALELVIHTSPAVAQESDIVALVPGGNANLTTVAIVECQNPLFRRVNVSLVLRSQSGRKLKSLAITLPAATRTRRGKASLLATSGSATVGAIRLATLRRDLAGRNAVSCNLLLNQLTRSSTSRFLKLISRNKPTLASLSSAQKSFLSRRSNVSATIRLNDTRTLPVVENPYERCIESDLSADQQINRADLQSLLAQLGTANGSADLNHDGSVSLSDLSILYSCWGTLTARPDGSSSSAPLCQSGVDCPVETLSFAPIDVGAIEAGSELPSFQVRALDHFGALVSNAPSMTVTLSTVGDAAVITGATEVSLTGGIAQFSNVSIRRSGLWTLRAYAATLAETVGPTLQIVAGAPARLEFATTPPTSVNVWAAMQGLVVQVVDTWGNLVDNRTLTLSAALSTGAGAGSGNLGGATSVVTSSGIASFNSLRYNAVDSFKLTFTADTNSLTLESPTISSSGRTTYVNAWTTTNIAGLSHFLNVPQVWNGWDIYASAERTRARAAEFAAQVRTLPVGKRNLMLRENMIRDRGLWTHPQDQLTDGSGNPAGYTAPDNSFTPYAALYWNNSAEQIRGELSDFFTAYKNAGGEIDHLIVHLEENISNWSLYVRSNNLYGGTLSSANTLAYFQAIENDPKLSDPEFGLNGSSIRDLLSFHHVFPNVYDFMNVSYRNQYLEFNGLMDARWNHYMRRMVTEVVAPLFPHAKLSNYGAVKSSVTAGIPDADGHRGYLYSETFPHQKFFNAQGGGLYGCLRQITVSGRGPDGASSYPKTPFNALRYAVNSGRSMRLSAPEMALTPWLPARGWTSTDCFLANNDYYQELLIHLVLNNVDEITLWNPYAAFYENNYVERTLSEADQMLGNSVGRVPVENTLASWTSHFITSCLRSDKGTYCRITPDMTGLTSAREAVVSENPLVLRVQGEDLALANAELVDPVLPVSSAGLWVHIQELGGRGDIQPSS